MKKKYWLLIGIIILAAVIRLWQLGSVPSSPDWDEAALGYNAYSIIHTGRDEYGKLFPIMLRSFDDYKPALYMYLVIPSLSLFGLTTFAVRLPSALFGILTVLAVYFLIDEFVQRKKTRKKLDDYIPLLTAFFLAISPWHIQFSRIAFESNIGLSLNIFGTLFFLKSFKNKKWLFLSIASFAASLYVYQSEKVFTPLLVLVLLILFRKQVLAWPKKFITLVVIVGLILIIPMVFVTLTDKQALARARGVSVFSDTTQLLEQNVKRYALAKEHHDVVGMVINNRRVIFAKTVAANYLSHYNLNWLFISGDIARHHAPNMGLLYLFELPLLFIGIYQLVFGSWDPKIKWLVFLWFLLAPVPASITSGVPHAVRTLNFLPTFQLFVALGIVSVWEMLQHKRNIYMRTGILISIAAYSIFSLINLGYYIDQYFVQQNIENSREWQFGYKEAVNEVKKIEKNYTKIIVSNQPYLDQSYIFFLFYLQYPPFEYQQDAVRASGGFRENHQFGKYEFRPIVWQKEMNDKQVLYVGRPQDFSDGYSILKTINYLDNTPAIVIATK